MQLGAHKIKSNLLITFLIITALFLTISTLLTFFPHNAQDWLDYRVYVTNLLFYRYKKPLLYESAEDSLQSPPPFASNFVLKSVFIWPTKNPQYTAFVLSSPLPDRTAAGLAALTDNISVKDLELLIFDPDNDSIQGLALKWLRFHTAEHRLAVSLYLDWMERAGIHSALTSSPYTDWGILKTDKLLAFLTKPTALSGMAVDIKHGKQDSLHLERLYISGTTVVAFYFCAIFLLIDTVLIMYAFYIIFRNRIIFSRLSKRYSRLTASEKNPYAPD
ncbi:MAG: hypothetical protein JW822_08885 [Spirochaetales bacterium]|nr:hypothetical protein [Spirochaetales bacterium]